MGTRETRLHRGRRSGEQRVRAVVGELAQARVGLGVSQRALAAAVERSQPEIWRLEHLVNASSVTFVELAEIAAVLGYELAATLHPAGSPIRDHGHQALLRRFRALLSPTWRVMAEAPFPHLGDRRSWDVLLRLGPHLVGVEAETRIRDLQSLTRRMRQRLRDGRVDAIVLVVSASGHNRRLVAELRESLGPDWGASPRHVCRALREARPVAGSAVVLL